MDPVYSQLLTEAVWWFKGQNVCITWHLMGWVFPLVIPFRQHRQPETCSSASGLSSVRWWSWTATPLRPASRPGIIQCCAVGPLTLLMVTMVQDPLLRGNVDRNPINPWIEVNRSRRCLTLVVWQSARHFVRKRFCFFLCHTADTVCTWDMETSSCRSPVYCAVSASSTTLICQ